MNRALSILKKKSPGFSPAAQKRMAGWLRKIRRATAVSVRTNPPKKDPIAQAIADATAILGRRPRLGKR